MAHIENEEIEEANEPCQDDIRWLRIATVVICVLNLVYVISIAVLIGVLKRWYYSIHCIILCLKILWGFVQTVKAKTKLRLKCVCWESCSILVLVLMTSFTLLTRQAYYHPSPHIIESKWVLFSLQASIIPILGGLLVMYEGKIVGLYEDRFILMIIILDFADIWDMASMLSQHKLPFLKEESSLEIAVQFFCSSSFSMFSIIFYKNIAREGLNFMGENDEELASNSQLFQNIPFLIIRILVLSKHRFVNFDFFAKNVILVILFFFDCCAWLQETLDDLDE